MAKNGFVIGLSTDTRTNPDQYWDGVAATADIDNAIFFDDIASARIEAARVQGVTAEKHVEAYSVVKTVAHDPVLAPGGTGI